ncbi:MAG TPA: CHASE sensor domain-containing protein, partial [Bryobacteraceae bacterium]|nr:CHASE sensor domain-containing protein [Bryobacteraceae bacterium]
MRSFRSAPIRDKLLLAFLLTTGGALAVAGLGIAVADSVLFRASLKRDLFALSSIVANNSTAAVAFDDVRSAEEVLLALRARPHIAAACIYRENGSLLARYQRHGGPDRCPAADALEAMRFEGNDVVVSRAIVLRGRRVGTLMMRYDLGELSERTRLYGMVITGILLASSLLAWLLSARLR